MKINNFREPFDREDATDACFEMFVSGSLKTLGATAFLTSAMALRGNRLVATGLAVVGAASALLAQGDFADMKRLEDDYELL